MRAIAANDKKAKKVMEFLIVIVIVTNGLSARRCLRQKLSTFGKSRRCWNLRHTWGMRPHSNSWLFCDGGAPTTTNLKIIMVTRLKQFIYDKVVDMPCMPLINLQLDDNTNYRQRFWAFICMNFVSFIVWLPILFYSYFCVSCHRASMILLNI